MERTFKQALVNRRSYYSITNSSPISDDEIKRIVDTAVLHVPSAFNSQTTRVVVLLGEHHRRLWQMVKDTLKAMIPAEAFKATEAKVDGCFMSGYGTLLFFEDTAVVAQLQKSFPLYAENFPVWSQQTSGMHQFAVWTMLEDAGLGVSLQHYNPIIDDGVRAEWSIPADWKLIAQMPFGTPASAPQDKDYKPLEDRVLVFK